MSEPHARKRMGAAVGLTLLFGPFGLFYIGTGPALFMIMVTAVAALFTMGVALLFAWPVCLIWAVVATLQLEEAPTGVPMAQVDSGDAR